MFCIFTEILIGKIGTCIMMSSRSAWKGLLPASFQPKAGEPLSHARHGSFAALSIGSLGIVYGDIGTSPLYAMDQLFFGRASTAQTPTDVLGGVSLVIWTITIIVAVKYAILVLRAQNDGEGGVFALYGLLAEQSERGKALLLWSLMLGAGLLFGDGIITPAISVLSAVEGLQVATPALGNSVVPITIGLLAALFAIQVKGTTRIGIAFGPVLAVWFVVIAALGGCQIEQHPEILAAFNPILGLEYLWHAGLFDALLILGALMLVVTGGEALYADMGHFGARPIRVGWFGLVYPALLLNYLGQGALLASAAPVAGGQIFFSLVPRTMLYPMVALATAATVIASQALISGAFSLASQAVALGLFPRLKVVHTHHAHAGQVYMPFINWSMYIACIILVVTFGSSSALASAYGLAVSGVMVITSLAMFPVGKLYWNWSVLRSSTLFGALAAVDGSFLIANSLKFWEGGFIPFSIGLVLFLVMRTWRWGRKATFAAYSAKPTMSMAELVRLHRRCEEFLERNALLMVPKPLRSEHDHTPALLQIAVGSLRSFTPEPDLCRSGPSQGALRPRRPLRGDSFRTRPPPRQHYQRHLELRLHGGPQRRAGAGRTGPPSGNRPADRRAPLDRARFHRAPAALQGDDHSPALPLSAVRAAAPHLATRALLLWTGRRGTALDRNNPCADPIDRWIVDVSFLAQHLGDVIFVRHQFPRFRDECNWRAGIFGRNRQATDRYVS